MCRRKLGSGHLGLFFIKQRNVHLVLCSLYCFKKNLGFIFSVKSWSLPVNLVIMKHKIIQCIIHLTNLKIYWHEEGCLWQLIGDEDWSFSVCLFDCGSYVICVISDVCVQNWVLHRTVWPRLFLTETGPQISVIAKFPSFFFAATWFQVCWFLTFIFL